MSSLGKRVAVIGLDGCSWEYLNKLLKQGITPYLKHLLYKNVFKAKLYAFPPSTPPSWSSIMTGVNPGKHGVFDFLYFNRNNYRIRLTNTLDLEHPRVHEILSFNKVRSIVINPIPSYPLLRIPRSIQISHLFFTPRLIWMPPNAKKYADLLDIMVKPAKDFNDSLDNANINLERYLDLVETLLSKESWNLFWINLPYPDNYLHKIDSGGILQDKVYLGEARLFSKIDRLVKLLDEVSDYIVIVSDHGFAHYKYILNINTLLYEKGLVTISKDKGLKEFWELQGLEEENVKRISPDNPLLRFILKTPFKRTINVLKKIYEKTTGRRLRLIEYSVDLVNSKAFLLSAYSYSIVIMDHSVTELVKDIMVGLVGIKNVYLREELFHGPHATKGGDVFIEPDYDKGYTLGKNKVTGIVIREKDTNNHHPLGILAISGLSREDNYSDNVYPNYVVANIIITLLDIPLSAEADGIDYVREIVGKVTKYNHTYVSKWKLVKKLSSINI